jgi:hypothetical protein
VHFAYFDELVYAVLVRLHTHAEPQNGMLGGMSRDGAGQAGPRVAYSVSQNDGRRVVGYRYASLHNDGLVGGAELEMSGQVCFVSRTHVIEIAAEGLTDAWISQHLRCI